MRVRTVSYLLSSVIIFFSAAYSHPAFSQVSVPNNQAHAWQAPLASKSLLIALDVVDQQILAVGERGHILWASTSAPTQWTQANVDVQVLLNAVVMHDARKGWAVGHDAVIVATSDGGQSWHSQFQAIEEQRPLFDIWFGDASHGIAIGAYGYYLATSDAGASWQSLVVNEEHDYHLNAITDNGQGELFIAAESGYVYRSADGGRSWETLKPPYEGSFFDIAAYGDNVIVTGLRGHVFVSRDRGDTWKPLPTDIETALTALTRLQNNQLVIVGHAGVVLLVDDAMNTASLYRLSSRSAISDVAEISANQLVLVGEHGVNVLNLCDVLAEKLPGGCE